MKRDKLAEIKKMNIGEIQQKVASVKVELQKLVLDKSINKLAQPKVIKNKRKDLAQMLTVLRQKEILSQLEGKDAKK